ncbi:MAG: hypothetical protein ACFFDN_00360 [Candidatus Hodarchaeota archaeon]
MSIIILSPIMITVLAKEKPSYVGINENSAYIWKTEFDKDPVEDYYEDLGYSEAQAENRTEILFDLLGIDDDIEGWRVYILKILDEKELDFRGDEIDYTPYLYNLYETDDWEEKDWKREEKNGRGTVYDYDSDLYLNMMFLDCGLLKMFVDPNTDWDDLADEFEEALEDQNEEGSGDKEERTFFFMEEECGISTNWEPKGPRRVEEFDSKTRYTREGVLLYYECEYDGDTIWKFELEYSYFHENWWWIFLIVLGIGLLAIVIVIIIKIKRK